VKPPIAISRSTVRILVSASLLLASIAISQQDNTPNDDEKKAIAAAKLLKAKATVDPTLPAEARVAVKLDGVNDAILGVLAKYPQIGSIQALESAATTKGYTALHNLPNLRRLILNKSKVTDKSLAVIVGCKELRELTIPESTVTDAGLASLTKLPRLEGLNLSDAAKVTDKGMATIKTLERLEVLHLDKTSITDQGLLELQPLEGLRSLSVGGSKVTQAAAEKFPELMPNLRVVRR
jgi:hypothetical protein